MSTQKMIMDAIKEKVEKHGFKMIVDFNFSNTGTFKIMNGFKTIMGAYFNFQNTWGDATILFFPPDKKPTNIFGSEPNQRLYDAFIDYNKNDFEINMFSMLNFIDEYLKNNKEKRAN